MPRKRISAATALPSLTRKELEARGEELQKQEDARLAKAAAKAAKREEAARSRREMEEWALRVMNTPQGTKEVVLPKTPKQLAAEALVHFAAGILPQTPPHLRLGYNASDAFLGRGGSGDADVADHGEKAVTTRREGVVASAAPASTYAAPPSMPARTAPAVEKTTRKTKPAAAASSSAAATTEEHATNNEKIQKLFEEGWAKAKKDADANRRLDPSLSIITAEQLSAEIERLRAENPGGKISLDELKSRFATDYFGQIILPNKIAGLDLHDVDFSAASLYGAQFTNCNLSNATLSEGNHYVLFDGCNLDRADFENAFGTIFIASDRRTSLSSCKDANFNGINCLLLVYGTALTDFKGATFEDGATLLYPPEMDPSYTFLSAKNIKKAGIKLVLDKGAVTEERREIGTDSIDDTTLPRDIRPYVKPSSFLFGPPTRNCDDAATIYRVRSSDTACEGLTLSPATSPLRGISPEIIKNFVTNVNKKLERYGLEFTDEDGCQDYSTTLCEADLKSGVDGVANTLVHGRKHAFAIIGSHLTKDPELSIHAERTILHELFHTLGLNHGFAGGEVSSSYYDTPPMLSVMNYDYLPSDFPPIASGSLAISDHKIFETIWRNNPQYKPGDKVVEMEEGKTKIVRRDEGKSVEIIVDPKNSSYTYAEMDPSSLEQRYFLSGKMRILNMRDKESRKIAGSVIVVDDEEVELGSSSEKSRSGSEESRSSSEKSRSGSEGSRSSSEKSRSGSEGSYSGSEGSGSRGRGSRNKADPAVIGSFAALFAAYASLVYYCYKKTRHRDAVAPAPAVVPAAAAGGGAVAAIAPAPDHVVDVDLENPHAPPAHVGDPTGEAPAAAPSVAPAPQGGRVRLDPLPPRTTS